VLSVQYALLTESINVSDMLTYLNLEVIERSVLTPHDALRREVVRVPPALH
jgi:hypothetical protein